MTSGPLPGAAIACLLLTTGAVTDRSDGSGGRASPAGLAAAARGEAPAGQTAGSVCALLGAGEIEAAFAGKLSVAVKGGDERQCEYTISNHKGSRVVLQRIVGETYESRRASYEESQIATTPVERVGQAAFLAGDSQIEVWVSDEEAISLGVMLLTFFGDPPVTPAELRAGLTALAGKMVGRL